jgi:hypothetical protein
MHRPRNLVAAELFLAGFSAALGAIVLLDHSQISYFLYYPSEVNLVLFSQLWDSSLFLASSLCALSIGGLLLATTSRLRSRRSLFAALAAVALWLGSFISFYSFTEVAAAGVLVALGMMTVSIVSTCDRIGLSRRTAISRFLLVPLTILATIEVAPLVYWAASSFNPGTVTGASASDLELNLTYSISALSSVILVLLLTSWAWVPLLHRAIPRPHEPNPAQAKILDRRLLIASFELLIVVSVLVFFYPYFGGQKWIIGVDSYINYYNPLLILRGLSLRQAAFISLSHFHGVYVIILRTVNALTQWSPFTIVKFAPLLLCICTSAAVFCACLRLTGRLRLAALTGICTLLWFPTTLGMWGGLQANWAAFFLWLIFISLMPVSRSLAWIQRLLQSVLSLAILLIHPWTWGVFLSTLLFSIPLARQDFMRDIVSSLLSAIALVIPVGVATYILFPGITRDMNATLTSYLFSLSNPARLLVFGGALSEMMKTWSSFLPPALLILSLIGVWVVSRRNDLWSKYLLAWVATWFVGSILVAPIGYMPSHPAVSETLLWRMLYVSPLPFLLAFGSEKIVAEFSARLISPAFRVEVIPTRVVVTIGALIGISAVLYASGPLLMRLMVVLTLVTIMSVMAFFVPAHRMDVVLFVVAVLLLIINGAFRSLYPLLLDPHNLFGPWR